MIAGATAPLRIIGGGTRGFGGDGEALSTAGMSGITLYEPGALTLVAKAGTPVVELEAALEAEGQRLAFEPMDHRVLLGTKGEPTLGGIAAANVSGPRRIQVGAARDFMLGVRFVDGMGHVVKNGGRVMKNVTGYDLVKLMAGSFGTLGVMTEVSLKVMPKPEASATIAVRCADAARAVAAMAAALGSPFDVTGAAFGPIDEGSQSGLVSIRIEGFEASVAYRAERLADVLSGFGAVERLPSDAAHWRDIRDVALFRDHPLVVRASIQPSRLPDLYRDLIEAGLRFDAMADWGGGLVWIAAREGANEVALVQRLRRFCADAGGHATLVKAPEHVRLKAPTFQPEPAALAALTKGLRAKFDPRGILNTGSMG